MLGSRALCLGMGAIAVIYSLSLMMLYFRNYAPRWLGVSAAETLPGNANFSGVEPPPSAIPQTGFQHQRSAAMKCESINVDLPQFEKYFKSQGGEDRTLLQWFNGLCSGTYLEMGALDGVRYSNSYFFNRVLNWTGLLVEMAPHEFAMLKKNRRHELAVVNAGVCDVEREVHYIEKGSVGGIVEFAAKSFQDQRWNNYDRKHKITCRPLRSIVKKHIGEPFYFDFFSLDIEGSEFEALQSLDFSRIGFGIIVVECDGHNQLKNMAVRSFLKSKGYEQFDKQGRNWWFFNVQWESIYKALLH